MWEYRMQKKTGAVTFLDVLGWKGIWQSEDNPVRTLQCIVEETKKVAASISKEFSLPTDTERGLQIETAVLSISDTIVLFTTAEAKTAIEIHARICAWLLPYALKQRIPLRGAIGYGQYIVADNIMLGAAVDEAASWHEATDWVGVILAPSAYIKTRADDVGCIVEYMRIPFKHPEKNLVKCVDWKYKDLDELNEIIDSKGPLLPEIAPKYLNTLAFLERNKENGLWNRES